MMRLGRAVPWIAVLGILLPGVGLAQDLAAPSTPTGVYPTRFRWGVNGALGYFSPAKAVDFGVSARFGAQLSDLLGLYADLGYVAGLGISGNVTNNSGSATVSGVGFFHIAPMIEADLGTFFVAGGPMLATGGWGQVTQGADSAGNVQQYVVAAGGVMPGLDLRTGFTFGPVMPGERHGGFTLGIDVKLLLATVTSVAQNAGPSGGSQSISTGSRVLGVTPMLMLGYDAK